MTTKTFGMEDVARFINNSNWKQSSPNGRYAQFPHEYTVLEWEPERELEYRMMSKSIGVYGYDQHWPYPSSRYVVRYLNVGAYKYWGGYEIINRSLI